MPTYPHLQYLLDSSENVVLKPGTYRSNQPVRIRDGQKIVGAGQNTILDCPGVILGDPTSGGYSEILLSDLQIRGRGSGTGLDLNHARASIKNVNISLFDVGMDINFGIGSRYERVVCSQNTVGMLIDGDLSTTLTFAGCVFDQADDCAVRVVGNINSILFTDYTYFQSSRRGIEIDDCNVVTFNACYWENIIDELIVAGTNAQVQSIVLINPIMIGGSWNDPLTDMTVFDDVQRILWMYGDCRVPKANIVRTTSDTGTTVFYEPRYLVSSYDWNNEARLTRYLGNGRMSTNQIQLHGENSDWGLSGGGYHLSPGDVTLSNQITGEIGWNVATNGTITFGKTLRVWDHGTNAYRTVILRNGAWEIT